MLEDGWLVVLETFQQLDRILHTPHKLSVVQTPTYITLKDANTTNELSLLSTCLDSLFANTQTMEDHAIIQVEMFSDYINK